ncbi:MAG: hypothetical protein ACKO4T_15520 [Planctomycetaceae bacterium]
MHTLMPLRLRTPFLIAVVGAWLLVCRSQAVCQPATAPARPAAAAPADDDDGDLARKAEIMNSPRWRRAIFELGEWLSTQQLYSPQEVQNIKVDFNRRVAAMSSYELDYLLDDLDAKFKIIDTPEARDAKQWLGQYLSVMSDSKRAEVLKDVPNVVQMSSAQLQQEITKIEQMKSGLQQRQAAFDQGRQQLVDRAQAARQATAAASNAAARAQGGGVSYSPYRSQGQGGGKPPFSDAKGSGMSVGVGPWGAYVNFNVGSF